MSRRRRLLLATDRPWRAARARSLFRAVRQRERDYVKILTRNHALYQGLYGEQG